MAARKYDNVIASKLHSIQRWAERGATNEEIARLLGISRSTLQSWIAKYPEFRSALAKSKEAADQAVEDSTYALANGFVKTIKKPIKVRDGDTDVIEYVEEEIYVPPNVTAQIFWLKNRQPDRWNDKWTLEHDGGVGISIESIIKDMSGEDFGNQQNTVTAKQLEK